MIRESAEGFVLGLAMGGSCLVTCLPFLVPYLLGGDVPSLKGRAWAFGAFLSGRLIAYLAVGALAGEMGNLLLKGPSGMGLRGGLLCTGAILLLVFSWRDLKKTSAGFCPGASLKPLKGWPFLTGLVLGFYPCAPFAAGLAKAASIANPIGGTLFFLFLFLGTTLILLPAPFIASRMRTPFFRRLGCFFGIAAGIWFLLEGAATWF